MQIVPITLAKAKDFIRKTHRHNRPPVGWKFGVGLELNGELIGVATAGRPVARHYDDGLTIEINRTCTDGTKNANSKLYGAVWKAAKAMGYKRAITYTRVDESGSSLRGAGWSQVKHLPQRGSWAKSSKKRQRSEYGEGEIQRILWEIRNDHNSGKD